MVKRLQPLAVGRVEQTESRFSIGSVRLSVNVDVEAVQ